MMHWIYDLLWTAHALHFCCHGRIFPRVAEGVSSGWVIRSVICRGSAFPLWSRCPPGQHYVQRSAPDVRHLCWFGCPEALRIPPAERYITPTPSAHAAAQGSQMSCHGCCCCSRRTLLSEPWPINCLSKQSVPASEASASSAAGAGADESRFRPSCSEAAIAINLVNTIRRDLLL